MMNNLDLILDEAFSLYNAGQIEQAEDLTRQVLNAEPSHGDALFLLGLIAYQSGALEPAADLLFQAVKLYPDIENYTLTLASVLQKQGRLDEALTHYEKFPNNPKGLAQRGFIYLLKNQKDFANSAFKKALEFNPELAEARLGKALLDDNITSLEKTANETNLPDAWYYLARHYRENNHFKKALNAIDKTGLGQGAYLLEKGVILEALNRLDDAVLTYRLAQEKYPYNADILANQANIFMHQGDFRSAEDYYKRALAHDSDNISARHNLADLMFKQERMAEALENYRILLTKHPNNIPALYNLAIILERVGEFSDAAGIYFKVLVSDNPPKEIEWRIAETLSGLAETNKKLAREFAKGWVKSFPTSPVAEHTLSALEGKTEKNILAYTKKLYDDFSETYDIKIKELNSCVIKEIGAFIKTQEFTDVLDLGCGTGAFGKAYGKQFKNLIGVDISEKMLKKAKKVKAYNTLIYDDILSFLSKNKKKFDLISAVEVLGYIPDILPILSGIKSALNKNGRFLFSVETDTDKPKLSLNGRYLYPITYIEDLFKKNDFEIIQRKKVNLRREKQGYAQGYIILAKLA